MSDETTPRGDKTIAVAAGIIVAGERLLVARRHDSGPCAGLWEFPGGKLEPGESPEQALVRELREELGVEVQVSGSYGTISHRYPERRVVLHFLYAKVVAGTPRPLGCAELRWVSPADLPHLEFPPADEKLVAELLRRHERGEPLQGPSPSARPPW